MSSCSFVSEEQQPVDLDEEMTQILAEALFSFFMESNKEKGVKDNGD